MMLLFTLELLSTCFLCGLRGVVGVFHLIAQPLPALMLRKVVFIKKKNSLFCLQTINQSETVLCPYLMVHWETSLGRIACQNADTIPRSAR